MQDTMNAPNWQSPQQPGRFAVPVPFSLTKKERGLSILVFKSEIAIMKKVK
jgi:hypothetical protein